MQMAAQRGKSVPRTKSGWRFIAAGGNLETPTNLAANGGSITRLPGVEPSPAVTVRRQSSETESESARILGGG